MSRVIVEGPEGEQLNTYSTPRFPIGTQLIQQGGRTYRFALNGGATLVRGDVLQGPANVANHVGLTAAAMAAGTRAPTQLLGATAAVINEYAGGFISIQITPDGGSMYVIDNHAAVLSAGVITANLAQGYNINTAWTTDTRVDFVHNPFRGVIEVPVTTITQAIVGVAVSVPTTGLYCWVQTGGPATVYTSGTLILGNPAAYIQVAGAAGPPATFATDFVVGEVMRVGTTTNWSMVYLRLE